METETHLSKKDGNNFMDSNAKRFTGGPSTWDPYSKGINLDELKSCLVSPASATPIKKMDISPSVEPQVTTIDESSPTSDVINSAPSSSQETAGAGEQTKKTKTLMDAVKPKHKRKKKVPANATGS